MGPQGANGPKADPKNRKRAPQACLVCRRRKVRCNVTSSGGPCYNCAMDNQECVVLERVIRRTGHRRRSEHSERSNHGVAAAATPRSQCLDDDGPAESTASIDRSTYMPAVSEPAYEVQPTMAFHEEGWLNHGEEHSHARPRQRHASTEEKIDWSRFNLDTESSTYDAVFAWANTPPQEKLRNADVPYNAFGFIVVSNLTRMTPEDINSLDNEGCLRVPVKTYLREFLEKYFLYVHPFLPLVNEAALWDMFDRTTDAYGSCGGRQAQVPLLIVKAIMFAASSYVSPTTLHKLGHGSIRDARRALYQQTRLLYLAETESSRLHLAQAALLLSFWSPPFTEASSKLNTLWLSHSVRNARTIRANESGGENNISDAVSRQRLTSLRRLWGCCIVRDCTISIGLRRPCQILSGEINCKSTGFIITSSDLEEDINGSKVYDVRTKERLNEIFLQLADLCIIQARASTVLHQQSLNMGQNGKPFSQKHQSEVRKCETQLEKWFERIKSKHRAGGEASIVADDLMLPSTDATHLSTILFTNLMHMYFYSAKISIGNHQMLQALDADEKSRGNVGSCFGVTEAASGIVESVKTLMDLQLVRFLPVSAIPCTALPLVLHAVDCRLKMSSQSPHVDVLAGAMKTYEQIYDGVEWVAETVGFIFRQQHLIRLIQSAFAAENRRITGWKDVLLTNPEYYLRIAATMDLTFCHGRLPEEKAFPHRLKQLCLDEMSINSGTDSSTATWMDGVEESSYSPKHNTIGMGKGLSEANRGELCQNKNEEQLEVCDPADTMIPLFLQEFDPLFDNLRADCDYPLFDGNC